jgi:hypothetical protein
MIHFILLHPKMTQEHLGFLPDFLSPGDPRPAAEQFDANYHFGGWTPFKGFKLLEDNSLKYPGDPKMPPLAKAQLRDELILFYESAWVAIIQPDSSFEVARLD